MSTYLPPNQFTPFTSYEDYEADLLAKRKKKEEDEFDELSSALEDSDYKSLIEEYSDLGFERSADTLTTVAGAASVGLEGLGIKSEPEMFTLPSIGPAPTLYKSLTDAKALGASIFGDDQDILDAREESEQARQLYKQDVLDELDAVDGGELTKLSFQATEALTQEIPFLITTGGIGTVAKAGARQALKKATAKKLGKAASAREAGDLGAEFAERQIIDSFNDSVNAIGRKATIGSLAAIHGIRSGSGTFTEAAEKIAQDNYKKILSVDPEIDPQEARDQAYLQAQYGALKPAIASGAITSSLVSLFGATGIERVFANPNKGKEVIKDFYKIFTRTGADASKQFGLEFFEEGLDSTLQGVLAKKTFDPKRSNIDILSRGLHDGFLGGLAGAKIGGTMAFAQNFENWVDYKRGKQGTFEGDMKDFAPDVESFIRKHAAAFDIAEEDIPDAAKRIEEALIKQYELHRKEAEGIVGPTPEMDTVTPDDGLSEPVVSEDMLNQSFAEGKADAESGFTESSIAKYNRLREEFGEEVAQSYMDGFSSVNQSQLEKQLEDDTAEIGEPTTLRQEVKDEAESKRLDSSRYKDLQQQKDIRDRRAGTLDQAKESAATNTFPEDGGTPRSAMEGVNPTDRFGFNREERVTEEEELEPGLREARDAIQEGYSELSSENERGAGLDNFRNKSKNLLNRMKRVISRRFSEKPKPKKTNSEPLPESVFKDLEKTKRYLEISETTEQEEDSAPKPAKKKPKGPQAKLPETAQDKASKPKPKPKPKATKKSEESNQLEEEVSQERESYTEPDSGTIVLAGQRGAGAKRYYPEAIQGKKASEEYDLNLTLGPNKNPLSVRINKTTGKIDVGYTRKDGKRQWVYRTTDEGLKQITIDSREGARGKQAINGAIIPESMLTKNALANLDEDGNKLETPIWEFNPNNKISKKVSDAKSELSRKGSDKTFAEEIVSNVKDDQLRSALSLMIDSGMLSEEGINSIILATNRYRIDGVYPRAKSEPQYLGQLLENSFQLLTEGSRYNEIMGRNKSGREITDTENLEQDSLKKLSGEVIVTEKKDENGIIKLSVSGRTMYLRQYKQGFAFAYDKRSIKEEGAIYSNVRAESKLSAKTQAKAKEELAAIVQEDFEGMNLVAVSNIVARSKEQKGMEETQSKSLESIDQSQVSDAGTEAVTNRLSDVPSSEIASTPETDEAAIERESLGGNRFNVVQNYIDVISENKILADRLAALREEGHIDEEGFVNNPDKVLNWAKSVDPNRANAIADVAFELYERIHGSLAKIRAKKPQDDNLTGVIREAETAKGKQQLEELLSRDDIGLSQEQRSQGLRLLQAIHPDLLQSLSLSVSPTIDSEGNTNITYEGSFNSMLNLAEIATSIDSSPDVVAHEIAHFTAKLLPQNLKSEIKEVRAKELARKVSELSKRTDSTGRLSYQVAKQIQERGEVTSADFGSLLPDVNEVGEQVITEIIKDTYYLTNSDEYYVNGLVNRNNQSTFKKGVEYVKSIIDAILSAFSIDTASNRNRERQFYAEVDAVFNVPKQASIISAALPGGLLFRGNVEAASVSSVTNPNRVEAGVDLLEQQGKTEKAENLIRQSAAATGKIDKLIRKHIAADANESVRRMLNLSKGDRINALTNKLPEKAEFESIIQKFNEDGHPELAEATALYAFEFLKIIERRREILNKRLAKLEEEIRGDKFAKRMRDVVGKKTAADWYREAEADASKALDAAIKILATGEVSSEMGRNSAIVQAVSDLAVLEQMQRNTPDLNNKVKEVASLLYSTPTGQEILLRDQSTVPNTAEFGNEIFNWLRGVKKGLGETITNDDRDMYRVASTLLASNANIKKNMLAVALSEDPDINKLEVEASAKQLIAAIKDPATRAKAIRDAMKDVRDLTTKKARAQLLMQQSLGNIKAKLRSMSNTRDAVAALDRVLNDPEFVEYRRVTGEMAGRSEDKPSGLPDIYEEFAEGYITIPKPPSKIDSENKQDNVVKVKLLSGGKNGDVSALENLAKLKEAANDIQSWLSENQDSPYFGFYNNTLQRINSMYLSEMVMHHTTNQRATPTKYGQTLFLGVMDAMLADLPTKSAAIARKYVEAHNLYYSWFSAWQERTQPKWRNLVYDAAKSHGYEKRWFGDRTSAIEAVRQWNEDVGRELRASYQEDGNNYIAGQVLSNGHVVTKQDIELLEYESQITEEAFEFNKNVTEYNESIQPQMVKGILGTMRLPVKRGKMMLPRRFSDTGINLIEEYAQFKASFEEKSKAGLYDILFNEAEETANALISFIGDRNPQWVRATKEDGISESVYNTIASELRENRHEDDGQSVPDYVAQRIADLSSLESVSKAKEMLMEEITPVLESLEKVMGKEIKEPEGESSVTVQNYRSASPFDTQRKDVLAPYFFYDYGFNNDYEFGGFGFKGATGPAANVVRSIDSAIEELNNLSTGNLIEKLEQKYAKRLGLRKKSTKVQQAIAKELGMDVKVGGTYPDIRTFIRSKKAVLEKYSESYKKAFTQVGSSEYSADLAPGGGERFYRSTIGGVLMSILTLARNLAEAPIHGGIIYNQLLGNGVFGTPIGFATGMLYTLQQGLVLAAKTTWYGGKATTFGVLTKSLPSAFKGVVESRGKKLLRPDQMLRGFIHPITEELANVIPQRNREYQMLAERGLAMPVDPSETAGNFDRFVETGGRLVEQGSDNLITRTLGGLMGQYESGLALVGRPIFPRLGDLFGNNILAKLGYNVAHHLEKRAREAYYARKEEGVSFDEMISPEELTRGNKASLAEARNFASKSGVSNLDQAVKDFWNKLEEAERTGESTRHINLFTAPQRDGMAATMVTTINMATPSNRPVQFRTSTAARWFFPLMGWPANAATVWGRAAFGRSGQAGRLREFLNSMVWIGMALGAAIPENWLFEKLMREIEMAAFGRQRITILPDEATTTEGKTMAYLGLAATPVPFVGGALNAYFTGLPGRAINTPGNLLIGKVGEVVRFAADVAGGEFKGDAWSVHGVRFANSFLPITRGVTRFMPYAEGMNRNLNGVRLIRRLTINRKDNIRPPSAYTRSPFSTGNANALTAPKKIWAGHIGNKNFKEAKRVFDSMVDIAVEQKLYKTKDEARRQIRSALRGLSPIRGAWKSSPTRRAFYEQLSTNDPDSLKFVKELLDDWERGLRDIGGGSVYRSGGKTKTFIAPSGRASSRRVQTRSVKPRLPR